MDKKIDGEEAELKKLYQYTDIKRSYTNTCLRCGNDFKFRAFDYDDKRFFRHCPKCKLILKKGNYDIDHDHTLGH